MVDSVTAETEPLDAPPMADEPRAPRTRRPRSRRRIWQRLLELALTLLVFVAFIWFWQWFIDSRELSPLVLPTPRRTWDATVDMFTSGFVWPHLKTTLREVLLGFVFGAVLGIGLAILLVQIPILMRIFNPYIIASQAAPKLALAPIFALWFGFGITSKVVIAGLIAFFPLLENAIRGLGRVDPDADELFRVMRAKRRQRFVKLQLPGAVPYIFTGMRVAMILALVGAVVGEYVGANEGLGALIISSQGNFRTDQMFASIVILTVMGVVLYKLVELAEWGWNRWVYRSLKEDA